MSGVLIVGYVLGAVVVGVLLSRMDGVGGDPIDFFGIGVTMLVWPVGVVFLPAAVCWGLGWLVHRAGTVGVQDRNDESERP